MIRLSFTCPHCAKQVAISLATAAPVPMFAATFGEARIRELRARESLHKGDP